MENSCGGLSFNAHLECRYEFCFNHTSHNLLYCLTFMLKACSMFDLTDENICLVESVDDERRESLPQLSSVYLYASFIPPSITICVSNILLYSTVCLLVNLALLLWLKTFRQSQRDTNLVQSTSLVLSHRNLTICL